MSRYFMYVLRCRSGSFYTGMTNDVSRRLSEHASGQGSRYTRAHLPVTLIGVWQYPGRSEAMRAEARFKTLTHAEEAQQIQSQGDYQDGAFAACIVDAINAERSES